MKPAASPDNGGKGVKRRFEETERRPALQDVNRFSAFKRPIAQKSGLRYVPTGNPRFLRRINRQRFK
jgi:hypothetical protein